MLFGIAANELHADANVIAIAYSGALEDRIHLEFFCNLRNRLGRSFVLHHRVSRDHPERSDSSQFPNESVSNTFAEVIFALGFIETIKRQHSDGANEPRPWPGEPTIEFLANQDYGCADREQHEVEPPWWRPPYWDNVAIFSRSYSVWIKFFAIQRTNEPIAASRQGFNVPGVIG